MIPPRVEAVAEGMRAAAQQGVEKRTELAPRGVFSVDADAEKPAERTESTRAGIAGDGVLRGRFLEDVQRWELFNTLLRPGGSGPLGCDALEEAYAEALADARGCKPAIDVPQCTDEVFTALRCPCEEIFVNPANPDAIAALTSLKAAWDAQACGNGEVCPAVACVSPTNGSCVPDGSGAFGGRCEVD